MHSTHLFLVNQFETNKFAKSYIQCTLEEGNWNGIEYFTIEGVFDFKTKKFERDEYIESSRTGITDEKSLTEFANKLVSKERYEKLKLDLERLIKSEFWSAASCICESLDGMQDARDGNWKPWSLDNPFPINDGYFFMDGIDDWQSLSESDNLKAVIVDFHS